MTNLLKKNKLTFSILCLDSSTRVLWDLGNVSGSRLNQEQGFFVPCSCRHQTEVKETRTHFSHTFLPNGWKSVSLAVQNVLLKVRNTSAAFFVPCSRTQLKVVPLLCYIYWANLHSKTDIEM